MFWILFTYFIFYPLSFFGDEAPFCKITPERLNNELKEFNVECIYWTTATDKIKYKHGIAVRLKKGLCCNRVKDLYISLDEVVAFDRRYPSKNITKWFQEVNKVPLSYYTEEIAKFWPDKHTPEAKTFTRQDLENARQELYNKYRSVKPYKKYLEMAGVGFQANRLKVSFQKKPPGKIDFPLVMSNGVEVYYEYVGKVSIHTTKTNILHYCLPKKWLIESKQRVSKREK